MIIDQLFKNISDSGELSTLDIPWIKNLIEAINKALIDSDGDINCLDMASSVKDLKEALRSLPAEIQISILNDNVVSFKKRSRRLTDKAAEEKVKIELMERRFKFTLLKYGSISLIFLIVIFIIAIVIISWKQNVIPDTSIASTLLNTLVEIFKLIFSIK